MSFKIVFYLPNNDLLKRTFSLWLESRCV